MDKISVEIFSHESHWLRSAQSREEAKGDAEEGGGAVGLDEAKG